MALVVHTKSITKSAVKPKESTASTSIVDSSWEIMDPNPDIHALFIHFNDTFFSGALAGCEVRWSPRMTYCAGVCVYEGRGGLCSVRLSQPLLKFRPRKDLVETLLHEMIHAYLFVSAGDKDRESHGPIFQSHMNRINAATGTNISIYHNFNAEVAFHRRHWWRCDGPCREKPPYYGYVKRAMNRAPGPNDTWHDEHRRTCGGQFRKIKEPEKSASKKRANDEPTTSDGTQSSKKATKSKVDKRFPGEGYVLGGKMRRLDEYFRKNDGANSNVDTSGAAVDREDSKTSCPVCQDAIDSEKINEHLDDCLTASMLKEEDVPGPSV